jgi:hypothetical protein
MEDKHWIFTPKFWQCFVTYETLFEETRSISSSDSPDCRRNTKGTKHHTGEARPDEYDARTRI